jgi:hypothetical protein
MVIASYYVLFAAMSDSVQTVFFESVLMTVFVIAAVVGFKSSLRVVVAGLAGHGVFDALHGNVLKNSGVPVWWPAFCLAYDLGLRAASPGYCGIPERFTLYYKVICANRDNNHTALIHR